MRLVPMLHDSDKEHAIFCRGHDAGASDKGAYRDLDSKPGGVDLYCARCVRTQFNANIVSNQEG